MPKGKKKNWVRDILEVAVAVIAAWLLYQGLGIALGTPMPMVSVVSCSMYPQLNPGDLIVIAKADYQPGNIAIYLDPEGKTIIHRVVEIKNDHEGKSYVFKGDNNCRPDPEPVPEHRILGKAILAVPLLGYPRMALMPFLGEPLHGIALECKKQC
jgi:signal peptidase